MAQCPPPMYATGAELFSCSLRDNTAGSTAKPSILTRLLAQPSASATTTASAPHHYQRHTFTFVQKYVRSYEIYLGLLRA